MWTKFGAWLDEYGAELAAGTVNFFLMLSGLYLSDELVNLFKEPWRDTVRATAFSLIFIFGGLSQYLTYRIALKRVRIRKLECTIDSLRESNVALTENIHNLIEGYLFRLADGKLNFGADELPNTDRITLYVYDEGGEAPSFVPAGRYSGNPVFRRPGDTKLPLKGCLAAAWSDDWMFCCDFPDPEIDEDAYLAHHLKKGITKGRAKSLTMRSRLYCGWKVGGENGEPPLGVVVIESTDPARFGEAELKDVYDREGALLADLLGKVRPYITNPSEIKAMGL